MLSLSQTLQKNKLSLIMSLPANDPDLFRAALSQGADAVKVHVNVHHRASGHTFGSFAENRKVFDLMLRESSVPLGLVLGDTPEAARTEIAAVAASGFSFISLYGHHAPCGVLALPQEKMMACNDGYSLEEISLFAPGGAQLVEASVIPGAEYASPLTFRDLLRYRAIVQATELPVVVPSQRHILPEDVAALARTGVRALMIGAVVTGETPQSVAAAVAAYRRAIDSLT